MIYPRPKLYEQRDGVCTVAFKKCGGHHEFCLINRDLIKYVPNPLLGADAYILDIEPNAVTVTASCECGVYRAMTSLWQLSLGGGIPCCRAEDETQFENRAYMLDISRCRMPKVENIKKLIDLLSELKYNEFQLYMESFCFKYSAFPKYTADFDCLTPDDIVELDKYCAERHIELVPNQNCFGHMKTWLDEEEFAHLGVGDDKESTATLNVLLPDTYEFVDKLFGSLLPYFTSKKVNIGLDEAYGLGRYQLEEECNTKGRDVVFTDWLNKVSDLCEKKYGKSVMFWSDMIINYPETFHHIPENAIALNWGYDLIQSALMEKSCMDLNAKGVKYYVCPGNSTWLAFTGRFDVMSFNVRTCAEAGRNNGAAGYLMTDWGCEEGHMHFPVWSLVPCALAAQYAWYDGVEQNGGMLKADLIRNAQEFVDNKFFGGKCVSEYLYRLQQYYLLEPERVHSSTMCCLIFRKPLSVSDCPEFFDLKNLCDDFYFDNVIWYVNRVLDDVYKLDINEQLKREIIINAKMVILAEELMKVRRSGCVTADKAEELKSLIDDISAEYKVLWNNINFEKGMEDYLDQLADRRRELTGMIR